MERAQLRKMLITGLPNFSDLSLNENKHFPKLAKLRIRPFLYPNPTVTTHLVFLHQNQYSPDYTLPKSRPKSKHKWFLCLW